MRSAAGLTPRQLVAVAAASGVVGILVVVAMVRGCGGPRHGDLEPRVARIEDLLGLSDAAPPLPPDAGPVSAVSADDRAAPCALAKVAAYKAWQDAIGKAKTNAAPAQGACAEEWGDRKKQACYYAATATVRTSQAAREAVMTGAAAARDALKNLKDDPKNDALPAARAATDAVIAACDEDGG